jgi:hypothetical protein
MRGASAPCHVILPTTPGSGSAALELVFHPARSILSYGLAFRLYHRRGGGGRWFPVTRKTSGDEQVGDYITALTVSVVCNNTLYIVLVVYINPI